MDEHPETRAGAAAAGGRVALTPAVAEDFSAPPEDLSTALSLLRRLIRAHARSLAIARDLFLAQEVAGLHAMGLEPAIDAAAASDADPETIDRAMAVVAAAEQAEELEFALSREWGQHCNEVFALLDRVEGVLARVPGSETAIEVSPA
jgi:hypothetical protein